MREPSEHTAYVDTWLDRFPKALTPEQLVSAFEQGFTALSQRAQRTLGDVTVSAIAERVLHDVSAQFPLLAALKVEAGVGVQFGELRHRVQPEDAEQIREGMRLTLIQFLAVMGNLTADILTPALHVELSGARVEELSTNGKRPPQNASGLPGHAEGMKR
jgi:hypothetical protein